MTNPYFASVFAGVERVALARQYRGLVSHSGEDPDHEWAVVRDLVAQGVDGLIVAPVRHSLLGGYAATLSVPLVFVDGDCSAGRVLSVTSQLDDEIFLAAHTLRQAGLGQIGYIAGRPGYDD